VEEDDVVVEEDDVVVEVVVGILHMLQEVRLFQPKVLDQVVVLSLRLCSSFSCVCQSQIQMSFLISSSFFFFFPESESEPEPELPESCTS